jgi:hypothetical protein
MDNLIESLGLKNEDKVKITLLKLLTHIDTNNVILCGGLAIRYHLKKNNIDFNYDRDFNDLDLLLKDISDLTPSVAKDFMVYHYHDYSDKKPKNSDDFFIALVDKESKIKVDIFSYNPYTPFDPNEIEFEGFKLKIRNPEDQLATQVLESAGTLEGSKIDPRWIENIEGLFKISDIEKADKYFHDKNSYNGMGENPFTESILEVYEKIKKHLSEKPELLVSKPCRRNPYTCELCEDRNGFTVVPMDQVYNVLGYAE